MKSWIKPILFAVAINALLWSLGVPTLSTEWFVAAIAITILISI